MLMLIPLLVISGINKNSDPREVIIIKLDTRRAGGLNFKCGSNLLAFPISRATKIKK
jgi:hypothetical protein